MQMLLVASVVLISVSPLLAQRDTIRTGVDLVVVPVSVRGASGGFVYGLEQKDFSIFEDGRQQQIGQFSIDPSPLSAVVLVDTGVGGNALRRFASSIAALSFAFADRDEVAVYRFDSTVGKVSDFTSDKEVLEQNLIAIQELAEGKRERPPTAPIILPGRGPRWLRWLLDLGIPSRCSKRRAVRSYHGLGESETGDSKDSHHDFRRSGYGLEAFPTGDTRSAHRRSNSGLRRYPWTRNTGKCVLEPSNIRGRHWWRRLFRSNPARSGSRAVGYYTAGSSPICP